MPVAVCAVLGSWRWTERPPETCRVFYKNKLFVKQVYLVGFTIGIYYDERTYERQSSHKSVYLCLLPCDGGDCNSSVITVLCTCVSCHLVTVHEAAMWECEWTDTSKYIWDDSDKESSHMQVTFLLRTVDLTLNTLRYYKIYSVSRCQNLQQLQLLKQWANSVVELLETIHIFISNYLTLH